MRFSILISNFNMGLLCLVSLLATPRYSIAQNSCSQLLSGGIFKYTRSDNSTHTYTNAKDWFCSSDFSSYAADNKTKAGGSIVIPGVDLPAGGNFDSSDTSSTQKRQAFCSDDQRVFDHDAEQFIIRTEGDPVVVGGFVACEEAWASTQGLLQVTPHSHSSGVFDVDVISKGYPNGHPLIVSVNPVAGASEVITTDFVTGTEIPQTGQGKSPLIGTYVFSGNSQQSAVVVRTTIGTNMVTAKRCPTGKAGVYTVRRDTAHIQSVRIGDYRYDFTVPQAQCHPNCKDGEGDDFPFQKQVGAGVFLRNVRLVCEPDKPGRPECGLDPAGVSLADDHTINVSVKSRTLGMAFAVFAEQWQNQPYTTRDTVFSADLQYFQPFSVTIQNGAGDLMLNGVFGNVTVDQQALDSGHLPSWLVQNGSPQAGNSETTYTLMVKPPECDD